MDPPTVDPNHDADIRIDQRGSEAAVPILDYGVNAMGAGGQPLPRIVLGRSSLTKRRRAKTDDLLFLLLTSVLMSYFANWKPSGTRPVFA